ncbi:hypothetical protein EVAR_13084_1 [Eumeta japonica]|uniref:Uncharacterized protein n=1 Tax=Eumeta variegata TaxID=151549 RepID=A0A4C1U9I6_EUMVA|nr:hypothetical protein EVAR_13084_1 [Eumeta japonica]
MAFQLAASIKAERAGRGAASQFNGTPGEAALASVALIWPGRVPRCTWHSAQSSTLAFRRALLQTNYLSKRNQCGAGVGAGSRSAARCSTWHGPRRRRRYSRPALLAFLNIFGTGSCSSAPRVAPRSRVANRYVSYGLCAPRERTPGASPVPGSRPASIDERAPHILADEQTPPKRLVIRRLTSTDACSRRPRPRGPLVRVAPLRECTRRRFAAPPTRVARLRFRCAIMALGQKHNVVEQRCRHLTSGTFNGKRNPFTRVCVVRNSTTTNLFAANPSPGRVYALLRHKRQSPAESAPAIAKMLLVLGGYCARVQCLDDSRLFFANK